jgi:hypothetical protein
LGFGRTAHNPFVKNIRMDLVVQDLNSEAIVQDLVTSASARPYRYALLGALSCTQSMNEFLPPGMADSMPRTVEQIEAENVELDAQEFRERVGRHAEYLPGAPQGNYTRDFLAKLGPANGQGYETKRMARLRYIVEGRGLDVPVAEWSTIFEPGTHHFSVRELGLVEAKLWRAWLSRDGAEDAELRKMSDARFEQLPREREDFRGLFRGLDREPKLPGVDSDALCQRLVEASVHELTGRTSSN